MSQAQTLARAADARRRSIITLRADHTQLIDQLAARPSDAALHAKIEALEADLAGAAAAIQSLDAAAEDAAARDAQAARELSRRNSETARQRALKAAKARATSAAGVDAAGDAFVKALQAMRDESQTIALDAQGVIIARHDGVAAASHAGLALPHAHGVSSSFATALTDVIRRAVAVLGRPVMDDLIVMNDFATTKNATFAKANVFALEQLEARL